MSSYITGFTPNYRENMAVKVDFLENRIFVLIYKIKLIQFILLILSKKKIAELMRKIFCYYPG